jgi:EAL domain-containing protein (putative c-di-GMP-specific phosphodiesterase class I)
VETLARWRHPVRGLLAPASFLSIAEDLEAVAAIDSSLMEQALSDFQRWRIDGVCVPRLSVNVSAKRLSDPNLAQELERFAIEPGTFSFELLETIFLDDCDPVAIRNLEMLRAAGIDIEIDDFGTGHASIVSLLTVSPQTLKIDRELVRSIGESDKQRKLVGSIIDIGRSLNIRVLAEGVETQDHVRILRDLGCDLLQGYALARPMPFEEIKGYIARNGWR